ncbi:MAG: hypothetical protein ACE5JF_04095 [Anaerolineales bacterium]
MRGKQTLIAKSQVDLVLVTAHYGPGTGKLLFARGYARRGQVWTDIMLFDRAKLVDSLRQGRIVMTGRNSTLAGDFEILSPVTLGSDDRLLAQGSHEPNGDDLELPIL